MQLPANILPSTHNFLGETWFCIQIHLSGASFCEKQMMRIITKQSTRELNWMEHCKAMLHMDPNAYTTGLPFEQ